MQEFLEAVLKNKKILAIGTVCLGLFVFVMSGVSVYNNQAQLGNLYEMKVKANEAEFDNMWKKIKQTAQIPEQKKEAFKEIFLEYAEARTSENAGSVVNFVRESNPTLDLSVYDNLMNLISGSRDSWTMRQTELVDIARQYNQNLVMFPRNVYLGVFFDKIDPKVITSGKTKETFESGEDNDLDLFERRGNGDKF
jgi:hypothetical protein